MSNRGLIVKEIELLNKPAPPFLQKAGNRS